MCIPQISQYKKLFENHYLFDLMGMAAAMSRNGNYVAADCRKIKKYVRQKLPQYLTDKKVSLYLKGSACVISVSVRALVRSIGCCTAQNLNNLIETLRKMKER